MKHTDNTYRNGINKQNTHTQQQQQQQQQQHTQRKVRQARV